MTMMIKVRTIVAGVDERRPLGHPRIVRADSAQARAVNGESVAGCRPDGSRG